MAGTNLFAPETTIAVKVALTNELDEAILVKCPTASIPNAVAGYAIGCVLIDTTTGLTYYNSGSETSCTFTLINSSAPSAIVLTDAHVLVGNALNEATDVAMSGDITIDNAGATTIGNDKVTTVKILNANVTLAKLAAGITPSHVVKYAGKITWSGSGASLATTVNGVAATDILLCTIQTAPSEAAYLVSAAPTTNTVTVTLSAANTSNDAVISYQVLRAAV